MHRVLRDILQLAADVPSSSDISIAHTHPQTDVDSALTIRQYRTSFVTKLKYETLFNMAAFVV